MAGTQLMVRRVSPWSVLKIAAAVSVVGFLAWMVAVAILFLVLEGMGIRDRFADLLGSDGVGVGWIFGVGALVGLLWAVLITALATLGAVVYNACSDLVGGMQITLSDVE